MLSITPEFIKAVLGETIPSFQLTCKDTMNLGFGFIFYGIVRTIRPKHVVVIGSKAGFSPIMFATGLKDNQGFGIEAIDCEATELSNPGELPSLHFVDPSYSLDRGDEGHWYGLGNWDNPVEVDAKWRKYGVEEIVTYFKLRSDEYLEAVPKEPHIDLLYVDGDHSYEGVKHDFEQFHPRLTRDAIVIAHDVDPGFNDFIGDFGVDTSKTPGGGFKAYSEMDSLYEKVRIPVLPGLAIMRKKER